MEPQPLLFHTLYAGAHLYKRDSVAKVQAVALRTLETYGNAFGEARMWVESCLRSTPVADQRIDFEDGYGPRANAEEDLHADAAARELAHAVTSGTTPPSIGIRVKAFGPATLGRAQRTLTLFFEAFARTGAPLPERFIVTLPKVTSMHEVVMFRDSVDAAALPRDREKLRFELMVEHPAALCDREGRNPLRTWVDLLGSRAHAMHLGAYDLLSEYGVAAPSQSLTHPLLDAARASMLQAAQGTSVAVVDGATSTLPIAPYKEPNTEAQLQENEAVVRAAFALHQKHVAHALSFGITQGWDLHPAQIAARYAALYTYVREHMDVMHARLTQFEAKAQQATRVGAAFDDAATARGLTRFFELARALNFPDRSNSQTG